MSKITFKCAGSYCRKTKIQMALNWNMSLILHGVLCICHILFWKYEAFDIYSKIQEKTLHENKIMGIAKKFVCSSWIHKFNSICFTCYSLLTAVLEEIWSRMCLLEVHIKIRYIWLTSTYSVDHDDRKK